MLESYKLSVENIREFVDHHPAFRECTLHASTSRKDDYLVTHPDHGSIRINLEGVDWDSSLLNVGNKVVKGDPLRGMYLKKMVGQLRLLNIAMYSVASENELATVIKDLGGGKATRSYPDSLRWIFSNIGIELYQELGWYRGTRNQYGARPPEFLITKAREQLLHHNKRCKDLGYVQAFYTPEEWKWLDVKWYPLEKLILKVSKYDREVAAMCLANDRPVDSAKKVLCSVFLKFGRSTDVFCTELVRRVNHLDEFGIWPNEAEDVRKKYDK